jgi:hypothetical protein
LQEKSRKGTGNLPSYELSFEQQDNSLTVVGRLDRDSFVIRSVGLGIP